MIFLSGYFFYFLLKQSQMVYTRIKKGKSFYYIKLQHLDIKIPGYITWDKYRNASLAIIARGINQYSHLSRRSIASPTGVGRNPSDIGHRLVQVICPAYRFSFSSTVFIRSSVNPNRAANFLKACILLLGIREYKLLIGVSLFNAFLICCFFIILS